MQKSQEGLEGGAIPKGAQKKAKFAKIECVFFNKLKKEKKSAGCAGRRSRPIFSLQSYAKAKGQERGGGSGWEGGLPKVMAARTNQMFIKYSSSNPISSNTRRRNVENRQVGKGEEGILIFDLQSTVSHYLFRHVFTGKVYVCAVESFDSGRSLT